MSCIKCKWTAQTKSTRDEIISQYGDRKLIHTKCVFDCLLDNLDQELTCYFYVNKTKYYMFPEYATTLRRFKMCIDAIKNGQFCYYVTRADYCIRTFVRVTYAGTWRVLVLDEPPDKLKKYICRNKTCYYANQPCEIHLDINPHIGRHGINDRHKVIFMESPIPIEIDQYYSADVVPTAGFLKTLDDLELIRLFRKFGYMSRETSRAFYEEGRRRNLGLDHFEIYVMNSDPNFILEILDNLTPEEKKTVANLTRLCPDLCKRLHDMNLLGQYERTCPTAEFMNKYPDLINWGELRQLPAGCDYKNVMAHIEEIPWSAVAIHAPEEIPDVIYTRIHNRNLQKIMPERCIKFDRCNWAMVSKNPNLSKDNALKYWRQINWTDYIKYHKVPNVVIEKLVSLTKRFYPDGDISDTVGG